MCIKHSYSLRKLACTAPQIWEMRTTIQQGQQGNCCQIVKTNQPMTTQSGHIRKDSRLHYTIPKEYTKSLLVGLPQEYTKSLLVFRKQFGAPTLVLHESAPPSQCMFIMVSVVILMLLHMENHAGKSDSTFSKIVETLCSSGRTNQVQVSFWAHDDLVHFMYLS